MNTGLMWCFEIKKGQNLDMAKEITIAANHYFQKYHAVCNKAWVNINLRECPDAVGQIQVERSPNIAFNCVWIGREDKDGNSG